jgi:hypothetical protein
MKLLEKYLHNSVALQSLKDLGRLTYVMLLNLFKHLVGLLGQGISPTWGLYLHRTAQHRKTRTNIHASNDVRTHNPNFRAIKAHALDRAATVTGTKLRASGSQQIRTTLQQRSPSKWRQLRTRSIVKLAPLYRWCKAHGKGGGGCVLRWPWSMQFGDG